MIGEGTGTLRISTAEIDCRLGDIDAKIELAPAAVATASGDSTDLIVFPELCLSGYSVGDVDADLSMRPDCPRIEKLARSAGAAGLSVGIVEAGRTAYL